MASVAVTSQQPVREALRTAALGPSVVTIGTFDGVHAGHRAVLQAASSLARERGLACVAVTFSPRPDRVLRPSGALPDLCTLDQRRERLLAAGADSVAIVPFSHALARLGYAEFLNLLEEELDLRLVVVGEDFSLGARRAGTPDRLRALGAEVVTTSLVRESAMGPKISSSALRHAEAARQATVAAEPAKHERQRPSPQPT